ncbi:MAG: hypothetical protein IID34_11695, partial [Planctomycetes bacterium]|nr:hypothetical protein [Planctomycetota bacterium]
MTGDEQKLARALTRSTVKIGQLEDKLRNAGTAGKDAAAKVDKVGAKAVPSQTITSLGRYAAGFVSIGAVVGLATKALGDFRRAQDEAAARIKTGELSAKSLAQVAATPEHFQQLRGISRLLRTESGLEQVPAKELTFATQSAGLLNKTLFFGGLQDIGFDPIAGVEASQKIQAVFGGKGAGRTGGGTSEQIINKVLAAAGESPEKAERIARSITIAGVEFQSIGGQDEALLAMVGVLSKTFKTTDIAVERIKSLSATVIAKRGLIDSPLQGLPLLNELPLLAEQGRLTNEKGEAVTNLDAFLGSKEAASAVRALQAKRSEISALLRKVELAELQTGTANDALAKRLAIVALDPQLLAAKEERIARNRTDVQKELKFGAATLQADKLAQDLERIHRDKGLPELLNSLGQFGIKVERFFVGDPAFLNSSGSAGDFARPGAAPAPSVSGAAAAKFQELLDMTRET